MPGADPAPVRERAERVFTLLDGVIGALPVSPAYGRLLREYVATAGGEAGTFPGMPAVQVPLLVHAAITGEEAPAVPVAAACAAWYLGVDLQDSVLDQELPPRGPASDPTSANLVATALIGSVPQLCVAALRRQGAPSARLWTLVRLFADALTTVMAGQHEDGILEGRDDASLMECQAAIERKSGAAGALLAGAAATLATEDPSTIGSYAAFGSAYGAARQLMNDVHGLWGEASSRDLLNGKRTLPVVHALAVLTGERRERLRGLLRLARESAGCHGEVRDHLTAAGSARYAAAMVRLYREQARRHLAAASPREDAGRELEMMLDRASMPPLMGEARA